MVLKVGLEKEIDLLCELFYKTNIFLFKRPRLLGIQKIPGYLMFQLQIPLKKNAIMTET